MLGARLRCLQRDERAVDVLRGADCVVRGAGNQAFRLERRVELYRERVPAGRATRATAVAAAATTPVKGKGKK